MGLAAKFVTTPRGHSVLQQLKGKEPPVSSQLSPDSSKGKWLDALFVLMILIAVSGLLYDFIHH
jgi:hypothetical protein